MMQVDLDEDLSGDQLFEHGSITVNVTAIVCWCGAAWVHKRHRKGDHSYWLKAGQQLPITCKRGHVGILRFLPETVSGED